MRQIWIIYCTNQRFAHLTEFMIIKSLKTLKALNSVCWRIQKSELIYVKGVQNIESVKYSEWASVIFIAKIKI